MQDYPLPASDHAYLERRYQECLARAESATDPAIAEVHRDFAAEYARRIAENGVTGRRLSTVVTLFPQQGFR